MHTYTIFYKGRKLLRVPAASPGAAVFKAKKALQHASRRGINPSRIYVEG